MNNLSHKNNQKQASVTTTTFLGPIPPPSVLGEYDKLKKGLAEQIIKMAHDQANHRMELEKKRLEIDHEHLKNLDKDYRLGQIFAFFIALITVVGGCVTAIKGAQFPGALIGSAGLAAIIWAFIHGRNK